jgi:hypothetical protein
MDELRIVPNPSGFFDSIAIFRQAPDGRTEVYDGRAISTHERDEQIGHDRFLSIPDGALAAIRDAIDDHLGVRYDESLVKELRATLEVERGRVDHALGKPPRS